MIKIKSTETTEIICDVDSCVIELFNDTMDINDTKCYANEIPLWDKFVKCLVLYCVDIEMLELL